MITYQILADGVNVTEEIRSRFEEMQIVDANGRESDWVSFVLSDPKFTLSPRLLSSELSITLEDESGLVAHMGTFEVDEVRVSGPPHAVVVNAQSVELSTGLHAAASASYANITLGALIAQIAAAYGYTADVSERVAGIALGDVQQQHESPASLLQRMGQRHDVLIKVANNRIVAVSYGAGESTGGEVVAVSLDRTNVISYQVTAMVGPRRGSIKVWYASDAAEGKSSVVVGEGSPEEESDGLFENEAVARSRGESELMQRNRDKAELKLERTVDLRLRAGGLLRFDVLYGDYTQWVVNQVKHKISRQGGRSSVSATLSRAAAE